MTASARRSRVVLVTGGASGIGAAVARQFALDDACIVVADRPSSRGAEFVRSLQEAGHDALFVPTDVTDIAQTARMVSETIDRFGRLDVAVNSAGVVTSEAVLTPQISEAEWNRVISTNLTGVWMSMKFEIPAILRSGGGCVINMSSRAGLMGSTHKAAYIASKHGVIGLTRAAALEFADHGVRVNAICPGPIDTPMLEGMLGGNPASTAAMLATVPAGRVGRADEVAAAVAWLTSDAAAYITGIALPIDGGSTAK